MKNNLCFVLLSALSLFFIASCHPKDKQTSEVLVSFNPEDTASVDALFDFYISNGIILPEMLRDSAAINTDFLHTYDCLIEGCEITHDYLQDSLSGYFFMELNCLSGTCGNNIYIILKDSLQFNILYNECGVIYPDLGLDTTINNFKVIYYTKEGENYRLFYDGKNFTSQLMEVI